MSRSNVEITRLGAGAGAEERGATDKIEEFKKFLEKLAKSECGWDAVSAIDRALYFVKDVWVDYSSNPPIAYRVFDDGIEFVWSSGLLLIVKIVNWGTSKNPDWRIDACFDHLARSMVYE